MNNLIPLFLICLLTASTSDIYGQNMKFTHQDTLRGSITSVHFKLTE